MKKGTKPVSWTDEEKLPVAIVCMEKMEEGYLLTQAMISDAGKEVLPKDRHRNFCGPTDKVWVLEIINQLKKSRKTLKAQQPKVKAEVVHKPEGDILSRPVATLNLSPAARRRLVDNGMKTIGDVCATSRKEFLKLTQYGTKKVDDIETALRSLNLALGNKPEEIPVIPETPIAVAPTVLREVVEPTRNLGEAFNRFSSSIDEAAKNLGIDIGIHVLATAEAELPNAMMMMKQYLMETAGNSVRTTMIDSVQGYIMDSSSGRFRVDTSKAPLKKVVIVGPRNDPAAELKLRYDVRCKKLTIWNAEQNIDVLSENLKTADEVIVMTDWCGHPASRKVKEVFKGKPHLIQGGLETMASVMESILK